MKQEKYKREVERIADVTLRKLAELQRQLSEEELLKYRHELNFFWIYLIKSAVGDDLLLHYLIDLLKLSSNYIYDKKNLKDASFERMKKIRENEE